MRKVPENIREPREEPEGRLREPGDSKSCRDGLLQAFPLYIVLLAFLLALP
jgi:hypothetical protein